MNTIALAVVSGVGLLVSLLTLSISLVAVQAMSGAEGLMPQLLFFCGSFALSFGLAAACTLPWFGPHRPLHAGAAFAAGGATGGVLQAVSLASVVRFEPQLRASTDGGPLGVFLLAGEVLALCTAIVVGRMLLRRARRRPFAPTGPPEV